MDKVIVLIHGRACKPKEEPLKALWLDALRSGIERDFGAQGVSLIDDVEKQFIYYGDLSNELLNNLKKNECIDSDTGDLLDRQASLQALKGYDSAELFNNKTYRKLPWSGWEEDLADTLGAALNAIGLGRSLIGLAAPDMRHYWSQDTAFGSEVRWRLTGPLWDAVKNNKDILLIAHSLGTMISWDTMWKFSYYGEYREMIPDDPKLITWITLGSPLGDDTIKRHLKGSGADHARRYPRLVKSWLNVVAEDDYVSHDGNVEGDYRNMITKYGMVDSIEDIRIFNLAVRNGKCNPHSSAGYLINPEISKSVHHWLTH